MNFLQAFLEICRGPAVFVTLCRQPLWKVILHLVIVTVISCAAVGVGRYFALKYFWSRTERNFIDMYGTALTVSSKGLLPEKDVNVSRRQELPYEGLIVYVSPSGAEKDYPDETLEGRNFIVIWTPGDVVVAVRDRKNSRWLMQSFIPDAGDFQKQLAGMSEFFEGGTGLTYTQMRDELSKIVKNSGTAKFAKFEKEEKIGSAELFKSMYVMMAIFNGVSYFFLTMILIGFGCLIYMVIFFLLNRLPGTERIITGAEMLKITIYAALPVLFVVNAFPMLQLPFEEWYDKIFLIGWIIYINVIRRYLERNRDLLETSER